MCTTKGKHVEQAHRNLLALFTIMKQCTVRAVVILWQCFLCSSIKYVIYSDIYSNSLFCTIEKYNCGNVLCLVCDENHDDEDCSGKYQRNYKINEFTLLCVTIADLNYKLSQLK